MLHKQKLTAVLSLAFLLSTLIGTVLIQSTCAYSNSALGFSIDQPTGWSIDDSASSIGLVMFNAPPSSADSDAFLSVSSHQSFGATAEELTKSSIANKRANSPDFVLLTEGAKTIGNMDGYQMECTFTLGIATFRLTEFNYLANGKHYSIISGAYSYSTTNYNLMLSEFEAMRQSFQILSTPSSPTSGPSPTIPEFPSTILIIAILILATLLGTIVIKKQSRKGKNTSSSSCLLSKSRSYV